MNAHLLSIEARARRAKVLNALSDSFDDRGDVLDETELDYLLASFNAESDQNLLAASLLFGLDLEPLIERAAIIQFDGKVPRVTANRQALHEALKAIYPEATEPFSKWAMFHAWALIELGSRMDMTVGEVIEEQISRWRAFQKGEGINAVAL